MADYYREGTAPGGLRVVALARSAPRLLDSTYHVCCQRCGTHHLVSHGYLSGRVRRNASRCKACEHWHTLPDDLRDRQVASLAAVETALADLEHERLVAWPMTVPCVRTPDGAVWPSLGRMGARWA